MKSIKSIALACFLLAGCASPLSRKSARFEIAEPNRIEIETKAKRLEAKLLQSPDLKPLNIITNGCNYQFSLYNQEPNTGISIEINSLSKEDSVIIHDYVLDGPDGIIDYFRVCQYRPDCFYIRCIERAPEEKGYDIYTFTLKLASEKE